MKKVMVVFGTRPEAIKLCPLVLALGREAPGIETRVCVTAQHREMLDQVLELFEVTPDLDLDLMTPGQTLPGLTAAAVTRTAEAIAAERPDLVIVQGDTTTTFAAALAAYYHRTPVAHLEAGLRTHDKYAPFPEELNRKMAGAIADLHFAATSGARENLLREGVPSERIVVTGNTVIDALLWVREKLASSPRSFDELASVDLDRRIILVTGHRRENFGPRFESICDAIADLARSNPDVQIVYPVHRNPNVTDPAHRRLSDLPNVRLIDPLSYEPFVFLMDRSYLIISDSGGVQEEAPSLGKPVLVTRDTTERQEAIAAGTAILVGADRQSIVREAERLLHDQEAYAGVARTANPFGDGRACSRVVGAVQAFLGGGAVEPDASAMGSRPRG